MSASIEKIKDFLNADPFVLDGGMGTLLEQRGIDVNNPMWSATALVESPDAIRQAHLDYYRAGARIGISASYQASFEGFAAAGFSREQTEKLMRLSVQLAREARDEHGSGLVAASVGPYGAMLADGSEYRGDYGLSATELRDWHLERMRVLASAGPDIFAVETIPAIAEIGGIVDALDQLDTPAWISVTVNSGRLPTGESLESAFELAATSDRVVAIGINCSYPAEVTGALIAARKVTDKPFIAYPNSGELWDAKNHTWVGAPDIPGNLVEEWLHLGITAIGGCCRVDPDEISHISKIVAEWNQITL